MNNINWQSNKFLFFSLLIHSLILIQFKSFQTIGESNFSRLNVPVSINIVNMPERIDNFKSVKGSTPQNKVIKENLEKEKIEKKQITKKTEIIKKKDIEKKDYSKTKDKVKDINKNITQKKVTEKIEVTKEIVKEPIEKIMPIEKLEKKVTLEKEIIEKVETTETISEKNEISEIEKSPSDIISAKDDNREVNEDQNERILDSSNFSEKKVEENEKLEKQDDFIKNGNFTVDSNGTYTAVSAKGINFEIIKQVDPNYPRQAEIIRYKKEVHIKTRFLVDLDGNIEKIEILESHKKFGFDKEVINALQKWKFKPIEHKGKNIKVYFNKEFIFAPKS
jgi:protein TonB